MTENKKITVLTLSDHPLSPSGVGTQTKYFCEALLKSGKFRIISLGGAIKHQNYSPLKIDPYGDDWTIIPVDGYGNEEHIRSIIRNDKPDILWFMTDPRFWPWLWYIENEVRSIMPMVYYHVWDNYPPPMYNKQWYLSTDKIVAISKVTDDVVGKVAPETDREYLPHAVVPEIFKRLTDEEIKVLRKENLAPHLQDRVIFFWNNRNARRKQSGTLIYWFKEFLDEVGHDNATLIMHTDPKDDHGQDLEAIIDQLKLDSGQILLSVEKHPPEYLAAMYNMVDCTVNISDAEGFGLSTLESLSCGTPIIVNMTGGLQEQVTDGEEWFGIGINPCSQAIIGSQDIPYIREDRLNKEEFISAMKEIYEMSPEERKELGLKGQKHVEQNYNFGTYQDRWVEIMSDVHERHGSWEGRKIYKPWQILEIS